MPAPVASVPLDPTGILLRDGFQSFMGNALDLDISLWLIEVGLPGMDGGDPIDITTQHNDAYRQVEFRSLITMTEFTAKCAYDPAIITQFAAVINRNTTITRVFPDGTTWAFFGAYRKIEFDPHVEGTFPTLTLTVTPSNRDPVSKGEYGPTVVSVAGT